MRIKFAGVALLAGSALWVSTVLAQNPQQPPPKPPAKEEPKKKPKKVWTNEDLGDVRKPWDEHADKKAAEAEAAAKAAKEAEAQKAGEEAAAPAAAIDPATGKPLEDPNSPASLEKQLKGWEDELKRTEGLAEEARKEMVQYSGVDQDRWDSAKAMLEVYEQNVEDIKKKIEEVRAQLAEAKKGSAGAKPPAPQPE